MKDSKDSRLTYNLAILAQLESYLKANPDIRFGQALWNLQIVRQTKPQGADGSFWMDGYYEEPKDTLKRVKGEP